MELHKLLILPNDCLIGLLTLLIREALNCECRCLTQRVDFWLQIFNEVIKKTYLPVLIFNLSDQIIGDLLRKSLVCVILEGLHHSVLVVLRLEMLLKGCHVRMRDYLIYFWVSFESWNWGKLFDCKVVVVGFELTCLSGQKPVFLWAFELRIESWVIPFIHGSERSRTHWAIHPAIFIFHELILKKFIAFPFFCQLLIDVILSGQKVFESNLYQLKIHPDRLYQLKVWLFLHII